MPQTFTFDIDLEKQCLDNLALAYIRRQAVLLNVGRDDMPFLRGPVTIRLQKPRLRVNSVTVERAASLDPDRMIDLRDYNPRPREG